VPPLRVEGNIRVAPSHRQEIDVTFRLPGVTSPDEVQSYRVAWTIRDGGTHAAQTAFLAVTEPTSPGPRHTASYSYGVYWWVYPWADDGYGWPYYYPVWPYYYGWAPYPVTYEHGGYWRYWMYPAPLPLPPSYLRSRHR
jgi:hypothetical protein